VPSFFFAEVSVYINEFGSPVAYFNWTLEVVILASGSHTSIYQGFQLHPKSESVKNLIATNGQLCSLCKSEYEDSKACLLNIPDLPCF